MNDPRLRISNVTHEHGYWQATVTRNGHSVDVDRQWGSWQQHVLQTLTTNTPTGAGAVVVRRDVPRFVAEALQAKVRPMERAQARQRAHEAFLAAERESA